MALAARAPTQGEPAIRYSSVKAIQSKEWQAIAPLPPRKRFGDACIRILDPNNIGVKACVTPYEVQTTICSRARHNILKPAITWLVTFVTRMDITFTSLVITGNYVTFGFFLGLLRLQVTVK